MELNEYQERAMQTCMPSCNNFSYMMLNLVGEVGDLSSKVAKAMRKGQIYIGRYEDNELTENKVNPPSVKFNKELALELGDIAWQLAGLCQVLGWSLDDVCRMNLEKLASRKERGVIDGNGDFR